MSAIQPAPVAELVSCSFSQKKRGLEHILSQQDPRERVSAIFAHLNRPLPPEHEELPSLQERQVEINNSGNKDLSLVICLVSLIALHFFSLGTIALLSVVAFILITVQLYLKEHANSQRPPELAELEEVLVEHPFREEIELREKLFNQVFGYLSGRTAEESALVIRELAGIQEIMKYECDGGRYCFSKLAMSLRKKISDRRVEENYALLRELAENEAIVLPPSAKTVMTQMMEKKRFAPLTKDELNLLIAPYRALPDRPLPVPPLPPQSEPSPIIDVMIREEEPNYMPLYDQFMASIPKWPADPVKYCRLRDEAYRAALSGKLHEVEARIRGEITAIVAQDALDEKAVSVLKSFGYNERVWVSPDGKYGKLMLEEIKKRSDKMGNLPSSERSALLGFAKDYAEREHAETWASFSAAKPRLTEGPSSEGVPPLTNRQIAGEVKASLSRGAGQMKGLLKQCNRLFK